MTGGGRAPLVVLSAIAVAGILAGGGVGWYLFSGRWTVAASEPHFPAVRWAIERVYRASVERHAGAISSEALAGADVAAGGRLYAENCARCHAAPGGERAAWVDRMRPVPPHLPDEGTAFDAAEVAWLLRNGIKMSGMPAWEDVLSEDELLSLTAFVDALPDVSPDRYAQMLQTEEEAEPAEAAAEETAEAEEEETAEAEEPAQTEAAQTDETTEPAAEAEAAEAGEDAAPAARAEAEDAGPAATVEMTNALDYVPETVTVRVGDTVRWTNPSDVRHTVTADKSKASDPSHVVLPEGAEPLDSGNIEPGGSWSHTFEVAGRYKYFCIPHEGAGMIAEVVVEE